MVDNLNLVAKMNKDEFDGFFDMVDKDGSVPDSIADPFTRIEWPLSAQECLTRRQLTRLPSTSYPHPPLNAFPLVPTPTPPV